MTLIWKLLIFNSFYFFTDNVILAALRRLEGQLLFQIPPNKVKRRRDDK